MCAHLAPSVKFAKQGISQNQESVQNAQKQTQIVLTVILRAKLAINANKNIFSSVDHVTCNVQPIYSLLMESAKPARRCFTSAKVAQMGIV